MISERKFAEKYTSFWNDILPRGAAVSRYINLQVDRFAKPLLSEIHGRRRALVNELGFRLFVERIQDGLVGAEMPGSVRAFEIGRDVAQFLSGEEVALDQGNVSEVGAEEVEESVILAHRTARFFLRYEKGELITPEPLFAGCGILEGCRGDVLAGSTLYEIKAGEGGFRLADLRQILTYCALNHVQPLHEISSLGFINPRVGVFFTAPIDGLVRSAAGIPADSLFFEMAHFMASEGVSS